MTFFYLLLVYAFGFAFMQTLYWRTAVRSEFSYGLMLSVLWPLLIAGLLYRVLRSYFQKRRTT